MVNRDLLRRHPAAFWASVIAGGIALLVVGIFLVIAVVEMMTPR